MHKEMPLFAFFGTPLFAERVLEALSAHGLEPALVVTTPDKPAGRGLTLTPSPTKRWALEHDIDVVTPSTLKDNTFIADLKNTEWDVFVVAAYGKLIPKNILDIPHHGALNVHPSLLPKFRGPSPVLSAILADERTTGVSIMQMDEQMDHGPVVAQARIELEESEWPPKGGFFEEILATEGGNLLSETLVPWVAGEITPEPQDEAAATYTKKFTDADARIDPTGDVHTQLLKIRAFDKNPRAYFLDKRGKRVIVTEAAAENGVLVIKRVIPEGKKEMVFSAYRETRG